MLKIGQIRPALAKGTKVVTISPTATIIQAARKMRDHNIGSLVVVGSLGAVLGIITERDILGKVVAEDVIPVNKKVSDIMVRGVISCSSDSSAAEAKQMMAENHIRHLPIIDCGVLVGMVSARNVLACGITKLKRDETGRLIIEESAA